MTARRAWAHKLRIAPIFPPSIHDVPTTHTAWASLVVLLGPAEAAAVAAAAADARRADRRADRIDHGLGEHAHVGACVWAQHVHADQRRHPRVSYESARAAPARVSAGPEERACGTPVGVPCGVSMVEHMARTRGRTATKATRKTSGAGLGAGPIWGEAWSAARWAVYGPCGVGRVHGAVCGCARV